MSRIMRLYKRLLDITLLVSYGLMLMLVIVLVYGIFVQAYDFSDASTAYIRPEFAYLRGILIFIVAAIIIFVVTARVFLGFIENTEKLETADDYRKKTSKSTKKSAKRVAFSQTDTYKKLTAKKESQVTELEETKRDVQVKEIPIVEETKEEVLEEQINEEVIEENVEEVKEETVVEDQVEETQEDPTIEEQMEEPIPVVVEDEASDVEEEIVQDETPTVEEDSNEEVLVTTIDGPKTTNKKYYTRLTKSDLNKIVSEVAGISVYKSRKFVNTLLDTIKDELSEGNEVKIDDFGKFNTRLAKEKKSRNPRTGEALIVPEHNVVKFTAFKKFKDDITNDVTETSHRYLLTKTVKKELSEDEVQNELIKEEIAHEHVEVTVIEEQKKVKKPKKPTVPKKTKADIIEYISSNTDLSKNKASKFLKFYSEVIKESLANKEDVKVEGFGTFTTIHIPTKEAVNPATGEKITVQEHNQVRMRFDKSFKAKLNEK